MSTFSQRNFSGGELSPSLYGRSDVLKYVTGARSLYNVTILRSGGVANRPGTQLVSEVYNSTRRARVIPFLTGVIDYVIELSHLTARVFSQGQPLFLPAADPAVPVAITQISQASHGLVTSAAHGLANGTIVYIASVVGMTELNGHMYVVTDSQVNTFRLLDLDGSNVDTSAFGAYVSGGTFTVGSNYLVTPFEEDEIFDVHYSQSGDTMTLTHKNHRPQALTIGTTGYTTIGSVSAASQVDPVTSATNSGAAGPAGTLWTIFAVDASGEESILASTTSSATPSSGSPITVSWSLPQGAVFARVFRNYGYIGDGVTSLVDADQAPDYFRSTFQVTKIGGGSESGTSPAPYGGPNFLGLSKFATSCFYQQRILFGADWLSGWENVERIIGSRVGSYNNFFSANQVTDSHPFDFTLSQSRRSAEIRHLVDFLGKLIIFTASGIHAAGGDNGEITPLTGMPRQQLASHGAALSPQPILTGQGLLYVQAGSSIVRDLAQQVQSTGYAGSDLTVFASHLFDGHSIVAMDFQEVPNPTVFLVRDDGILLTLAYLKEQEIWGWTRCEMANDGLVESVCVVPDRVRLTADGFSEIYEEVVYFVVKRGTDRFIEKLTNRYFTDVKDAVFLDSSLSFDGRNTDTSHTMTLSGSGWTYSHSLTITSSGSFFSADDVGNEIHLTGSDGTLIRFTLDAYSSPTVMTGRPNKTVPTAMRATAISDWARAVDVVDGLEHLEGQNVGVFADGFVVANPLNPTFTNTITVTSGEVTLPRCYAVIHVGLPYYSDIETLDIDIADRESLVGKKMQIGKVHVRVEKSRGFFAGNRSTDSDATLLTGLYETKLRDDEDYDSPIALRDEVVELLIQSEWNSNGRVLVRNVDPIPLTVLSIHPEGHVPVRK